MLISVLDPWMSVLLLLLMIGSMIAVISLIPVLQWKDGAEMKRYGTCDNCTKEIPEVRFHDDFEAVVQEIARLWAVAIAAAEYIAYFDSDKTELHGGLIRRDVLRRALRDLGKQPLPPAGDRPA